MVEEVIYKGEKYIIDYKIGVPDEKGVRLQLIGLDHLVTYSDLDDYPLKNRI